MVRWWIVTDDLTDTPTAEPPEPEGPIVSPESRFLFVDVAAMRAKQLRRGALPKIEPPPEGEGRRADAPKKAERIAMEEVQRGVVRPLLPENPPIAR